MVSLNKCNFSIWQPTSPTKNPPTKKTDGTHRQVTQWRAMRCNAVAMFTPFISESSYEGQTTNDCNSRIFKRHYIKTDTWYSLFKMFKVYSGKSSAKRVGSMVETLFNVHHSNVSRYDRLNWWCFCFLILVKKWPKYAGISQNTKSPKTNSWNLKNHPLKLKKKLVLIYPLCMTLGFKKLFVFGGCSLHISEYLRIESQKRVLESVHFPGLSLFYFQVLSGVQEMFFLEHKRWIGDMFYSLVFVASFLGPSGWIKQKTSCQQKIAWQPWNPTEKNQTPPRRHSEQRRHWHSLPVSASWQVAISGKFRS